MRDAQRLTQPVPGRRKRLAADFASNASTPADGVPLLFAEGLSLQIASRLVLDEVSLSVSPGELVVVMGRSGAGKTTLLKCLNRLVAPDSGHVWLRGTDTAQIPPHELRRRVGLVWQIPFMFEGSVAENLRRAARYAETEIDDRQVGLLLDQIAFDGAADVDARKLSVGQQQRVALARALVVKPDVLLCDEPTASLDHAMVLRLEATLQALRVAGMGIVFVTHDAAQADRIADRQFVLDNAQLAERFRAQDNRS